MAAVVGSSSTPVRRTPAGAKPRKFPDPDPGSSTRAPSGSKPICARSTRGG